MHHALALTSNLLPERTTVTETGANDREPLVSVHWKQLSTAGITRILSIGREMIGLYQRYGGPEFELIAVPCNQFFNQEPGSNEGEFSSTAFEHEPAFENHQMHLMRSATRFR
jgi:hypothetical protein